jgi:N-formylglutamate amidohydrolase
MVPSRFSGDPRLSAVMIEVNKSLYMDETTLAKLPSFRGMQGKLREVMANLIETWEQNRIESSRFLGKGHLQFRRCMI